MPRERKLCTNHESHVGRLLPDAKCVVDINDDFDVGGAERRRCPARPNVLSGRRRRQRDPHAERHQQAKLQHGRRREVIDAPEIAAVLERLATCHKPRCMSTDCRAPLRQAGYKAGGVAAPHRMSPGLSLVGSLDREHTVLFQYRWSVIASSTV